MTLFGLLLLHSATLPVGAREYLESAVGLSIDHDADPMRALAQAVWWYESGRPVPEGFEAMVEAATR